MAFLLSALDGKRARQTLPMDELTAGMTLAQARKAAADLASIPEEDVRLLYKGRFMEGDEGKKLVEFGVKNGSNVHVLRKPRSIPPQTVEPKEMSDEDIRKFMFAFGMILNKPDSTTAFKRLTESKESMETLSATCPGLAQDPLAMAFLAKTDMLMMLMKKETLRKVAREHPALIEAMDNLMAAVHEEMVSKVGGKATTDDGERPVVHPFEYSIDEMDAMDDDEEDDEDDAMMGMAEAAAAGGAIQRNRSYSSITPNQLSDALRNVQNVLAASNGGQSQASGGASSAAAAANVFGGLFQGMTGMTARPNQDRPPQQPASASSSSSSNPSSSQLITQDMFRAAMQQALAATGNAAAGGGGTQSAGPSAAAPPVPMETEDKSLEESLKTMKEMGIADEALAKKALKVMGGDLQAAVDLILSGWDGEDDESAD